MASIVLPSGEIWIATKWILEGLDRSVSATFTEGHEISCLFREAIVDWSFRVDLSEVRRTSIVDLSSLVTGIYAAPEKSVGFEALDAGFKNGLMDRLRELQALLDQSLKGEENQVKDV